jgi:hypothetical protein
MNQPITPFFGHYRRCQPRLRNSESHIALSWREGLRTAPGTSLPQESANAPSLGFVTVPEEAPTNYL